MNCFIPAAGFGKRMGDLTRNLPKPLLEINGIALLDLAIFNAYHMGARKFCINTHYLAPLIHKHLEKFESKLDIKISFEEEKILGTAGGIHAGIDGYFGKGESFLCLNPDVMLFLPEPFQVVPQNYSGSPFLYLYNNKKNENYTGLDLQNGKVRFGKGEFFFIGLSILNTDLFDSISKNEYSDLSELFRKLSEEDTLEGGLFSGHLEDLGELDKFLNYQSDEMVGDYFEKVRKWLRSVT